MRDLGEEDRDATLCVCVLTERQAILERQLKFMQTQGARTDFQFAGYVAGSCSGASHLRASYGEGGREKRMERVGR